MPEKMQLWSIDFIGMFPVGNVFIILAPDEKTAMEIATKTIEHTSPKGIKEIPMDSKRVIAYLSGDY